MRIRFGVLALVAWLSVPVGAMAADITVFAAASLKNALDAMAGPYQAATGDRLIAVYASSGVLAKQIEQGAPADLFISADQEWMDYLQQRGLIRPDSRRDLLGNRLVLIAPADRTVTLPAIAPGLDLVGVLGRDGRLALPDETVPAGKYGRQALNALGAWNTVAARVTNAENVRAALRQVALGEVPLGIVYASDAIAESAVKQVGTFPESTHTPIRYPVALTKAASKQAERFLAHLGSSEARAAFERQGFQVLP